MELGWECRDTERGQAAAGGVGPCRTQGPASGRRAKASNWELSRFKSRKQQEGLEMRCCMMRAAGGKEVMRREGLAASRPAASITGPRRAINKWARHKAAWPVGCRPHPEREAADEGVQSSVVSGACRSGLGDCCTPESRGLFISFCFPVGSLLAPLQTRHQCPINILSSACVNGWRNSWSSRNSY